jgi:hypothetical protein
MSNSGSPRRMSRVKRWNCNFMSEFEIVYDVHSKTYTALLHIGWHLLDMAERFEEGSLLNLQAAIVFFAFTFEAYLNHVGGEDIKFWDEIDRISYAKKLTVLEKQLGFDRSNPSFQTIQKLFEFRNNFAHGRTIKKEIRIVTESPPSPFHSANLLSHEQITKRTVRQYHGDVKAAIELINAARPKPDALLWDEGSRDSVTRKLSS